MYVHKYNGDIVYVGSGSERRPLSKTNRCQEHLEVFDKLEIEIIADNLSTQEANRIEQELLNSLTFDNLFNKRKEIYPTKELSFNYLNEFLYYDEESPTYLRWKCDRKKIKKDAVAGTRLSTGYMQVQLNSRFYLCHRVIFCLMHKSDLSPSDVVDHIDGNRMNNRIENLRTVSQSFNSRNRKHRVSTKTGLQNITDCDNCISVQWRENGVQENKRFSYSSKPKSSNKSHVGTRDDALKLALAFRSDLESAGVILVTSDSVDYTLSI